jgi:hypothetical protein
MRPQQAAFVWVALDRWAVANRVGGRVHADYAPKETREDIAESTETSVPTNRLRETAAESLMLQVT